MTDTICSTCGALNTDNCCAWPEYMPAMEIAPEHWVSKEEADPEPIIYEYEMGDHPIVDEFFNWTPSQQPDPWDEDIPF